QFDPTPGLRAVPMIMVSRSWKISIHLTVRLNLRKSPGAYHFLDALLRNAVMAEIRWFIARNKGKVGPFYPLDLQHLGTYGLLTPTEYWWTEGASKWVEASAVPGLFPQAGQKKYWLSLAGQTRGPYLVEQLRAALTIRQVTLETLACAEGANQWAPLRQV